MKKLVVNPGIWTLDLSKVLLNKTESNSFFSDSFFGTITYPFDINIDSSHAQFIYHYNQDGYQKVYDHLLFLENGKMEECRLIILSFEGKKMSAQLVLGFENFPNFDKKLSELPLHKFKITGQTLYQYANSLVEKKYPEVDFNYPAFHTEEINTNSTLFSSFRGTFNLRENGAFIENKITSGVFYNYSLVQPAIYFLYLLKAGFSDAGYTVSGDIFEDEMLQKTIIFKPESYNDQDYPEPIHWESIPEINEWNITQPIPFNGTFRISGSVWYYQGVNHIWLIDQSTEEKLGEWTNTPGQSTFNINITVQTNKDSVLKFMPDVNVWIDLTVAPVEIYHEDGSVLNPLFDTPEVDLTKNVPDCTFGELIRAFKNTVNYDLDREQKHITMNFIEKKIKGIENVKDISAYQVQKPKITFNEELSFLLQYQNKNEDYPLDSLYVDKNGVVVSGTKKDNTSEITSPIIPLPSIFRNAIDSAKIISSSSSDIQVALYSGLVNGQNSTLLSSPLLWNQLYENYWKEWLEFRRFSDSFTWEFTVSKEEMKDLTVKTKIYAYNRLHFIKKLDREDLSQVSEKISLETYSE